MQLRFWSLLYILVLNYYICNAGILRGSYFSRSMIRDTREKVTFKSNKLGENEYKVNVAIRMMTFWSRAINIYRSYKMNQLKMNVLTSFHNITIEQRDEYWKRVHDINSDRMLALCLNLRGFYLKVGQVLGTRADFMPPPYIKKLSQLHDRVPKVQYLSLLLIPLFHIVTCHFNFVEIIYFKDISGACKRRS